MAEMAEKENAIKDLYKIMHEKGKDKYDRMREPQNRLADYYCKKYFKDLPKEGEDYMKRILCLMLAEHMVDVTKQIYDVLEKKDK